MHHRLSLIAAFAAVLACTPEPKRRGDQAAAEPGATQTGGASRRVPRPESTRLLDLQDGQWIRYRVSRSDGRSEIVTYKVVGREQDAHWLEVVTGVADAGTVLGLLIRPAMRSAPTDTALLAARIRMPNGLTKELRGKELEISRSGYLKVMSPLFVPGIEGATQQPQAVPAGTFEGCLRQQRRLTLGGLDGDATVWIHPAVPLTGLVKAVDKTQTMKAELLDYGTKGAVTSMPRR